MENVVTVGIASVVLSLIFKHHRFWRGQSAVNSSSCGPPSSSPPLPSVSVQVIDALGYTEDQWAQLNMQVANGQMLPKVIHFVRHGEGNHNLAERKFGTKKWEASIALGNDYLDSPLNLVGIEQCQELGAALRISGQRGMIVQQAISSPLTRALETAELCLGQFSKTDGAHAMTRVVQELCRETMGRHTCDKRRPVSKVSKEFSEWDFSSIKHDEDPWWTTERESAEARSIRARLWLREQLIQNTHSHIMLINHSGFIGACLQELGHPSHLHNAEIFSVLITTP